MAIRPDLYQVAEGLAIQNGAQVLSASGVPGGDGSIQDQAPIGSIFLRIDIGSLYTKINNSNNPSDWIISLTNQPFSYSAINGDSIPLVMGTPVILQSGQFIQAAANSSATIRVVGLILNSSASVASTASVQMLGTFIASTSQWDAVTGGTGGLTPGPYYLSTTTGMITNITSSTPGDYIVELGLALNSTSLKLQIQPPLAL